MTLADELLGIRPHITVTGKYVCHDDPVQSVTVESFREWAAEQDEFTVNDLQAAFDCAKSRAASLVEHERRVDRIEVVGRRKSLGRPLTVWRVKATPMTKAERANRKFFGA